MGLSQFPYSYKQGNIKPKSLQADLFITSSRHLKLVEAEYGFDTELFSKREMAC